MDGFIKINDTLINGDRLLALQHRPTREEGSFHSTEHYLAVFDNGYELRLSPEDGRSLVEYYPQRCINPLEGIIATTSESAT
jgi:hypothetical protein